MMIEIATSNILSGPESLHVCLIKRTCGSSNSHSSPLAFLVVGGWCSRDAISSVERYDPQTNEWRMVASMSKRRCGVGVSVLDDLLYAVGGHDGSSYLNSVERLGQKIAFHCLFPTAFKTGLGSGLARFSFSRRDDFPDPHFSPLLCLTG